MPLFRSNAELSILLDQPPSSLFTPGSVISGRVVLRSPDDEDVDSISICFIGKSKVYITRRIYTGNNNNRTIYYRDRASFFTFGGPLFNGPFTLPGNREHSWPFHFTFPTTTVEDRSSVYDSADSQNWTTAPHALPPNFQDDYGTNYTTISYLLEASLNREHKQVDTELYLNFSPLRQPLPPPPPLICGETYSFASSRLHAGHEDKRRSMKEALTDRFSKSTPTLAFNVVASIPKVVVSGQDFPLSISLQIETNNTTAEIIPAFDIKIQELYLECYTHCRAMIDSAFTLYSSEIEKIFDSSTTLAHSLPEMVISRTAQDISKAIDFNANLPVSVCPSFRSYAITRTYRLMMKVRVETSGKEFDAKFDVPAFTVLPFVVAGGAAGTGLEYEAPPMLISREQEAPALEDEELPSYGNAVKQ